VSLEDRITEACNECSAIYVPFGSMLTDQMDVIGNIAKESKVVVVAGDTNIGQNALVTLFHDPYTLGYAAGKKAVRVFNGDDIATIKIGYGEAEDSIKLYNGEIAETFEKEFPKSFKEFNEFLETYEPGSSTTRYEKPSEEE
jgi:putative ABC transport system substrate-binding protein